MNKTSVIIFFLTLATISYGQTTQTKYFTSEWLVKEVPKGKAKFSQTVIQNADGTTTTEVKDLTRDMIIRSETYKGNEQYGIWKSRSSRGRAPDYNFPLLYADKKCTDSITVITKDYFQDNDSLRYKAPKMLTGELTISQFVNKNIIYPERAKDEDIQGTVYVRLTLTKEGSVENVVVGRGVNPLIDKEAVRVIRQLRFSSPPTIGGQPFALTCLSIPIKFVLE